MEPMSVIGCPSASLGGNGISASLIENIAPVNITPPVITSNHSLTSPHAGDVLTVAPGKYTDSPQVSRNWESSITGTIAGATGLTYTIQPADSGKIFNKEIASNPAGQIPINSNMTGTIT